MNKDMLNPNIYEMFRKFENMSFQYLEDHPEIKKELIDALLSIMPPREKIDNHNLEEVENYNPVIHLPGDTIIIKNGEIK